MAGRLNFVCVDNSEFSENAFDWYINNYHKADDTIGLVYVHQISSVPTIGLMTGGEALYEECSKEIEKNVALVNSIQSKFGDLCSTKGYKHHFLVYDAHNSPGHVICKAAKERNAKVIVMGQRGLGTISRALLGSTSDYVLHHAHIPVMVVPPVSKK